MTRFSLDECARLLGVPLDGGNSPLSGFCVDTRLLRPGNIFFALPGYQTDGHHFLEQAAHLGASAAVVSQSYHGLSYGMSLIRVPNPLAALQDLAQAAVSHSKSQIVAITGSIGKTTTKEFTATLLAKKYKIWKTPGNQNSQIGLPLSILNETTGHEEVLVVEMSLSEKRHIGRLVEIVPPSIAVITTTALVHAHNFESLQEIGVAKAEIFSHPRTHLGILHHDIVNFEEICTLSPCYKVSFSTQTPEADYYLDCGSRHLRILGKRFSSATLKPLRIPGKHNNHNFLAAAIVARHLGVDWETIEDAIDDLLLPEMRLECIEKQGILFVNDSYNASELSMKAALDSLPPSKPGGKRVAILGEMLELGKFSDGCHRSVGEYALNFVDAVICYGEHCRPLVEVWEKAGKPAYLTDDRQDLVKKVKNLIKAGDVVLLKGSRSKGMWKILDEY